MIRIRGLHKSFGELHVLRGIDLDVSQGEVSCIVGPSGSGKSTLLRCINLLIEPDRGDIFLEEVRITDPQIRPEWVRQQVGMVFQSFNLLTHLTALRNVTLGLTKVKGMEAAAARDKAIFELERVGLAHKVDAYPAQLSGGQQQRVAIARALVNNPGLILADEPTGNLDSATGDEILALFQRLRGETGAALLIITHDEKVAALADRVVRMQDGRLTNE